MDPKPETINSNELTVMKKCRRVMENLGLCNESMFHTFELKPKITVPVWIIRIIYSVPMCTCVILAFWHIIDKNLNLTASSVAVIIIVGGGHCQVIYFLLITKNKLLIDTIDQLQKLVDLRRKIFPMSNRFYQEAEVKSVDLVKRMMKMFVFAFCFLFTPPVLVPLCYVIFGVPKTEYWMLPLDIKVMFDDKTPIGFYINLLPQALTGCNTWLNWILFLSFIISLLTYIEACVADFEASLDEICNQYDDLGKSKLNTDLFMNQTIELHAELTKIFENVRVLTSQPLFVQALNFVIFTAFVMLTIEQNIQNLSPVTFFCFVAFSTQTLTNFVTYRTAEAYSENSIRFVYIIQRSFWYKLPVNQQKKLIFTIERAEKSFLLTGSGIFQINMAVFANYFRLSCTYYLMLRQLRQKL